MSPRDKAESKSKPRHGPKWHDSKRATKAHRAASKEAKRARRRVDEAVIVEEREEEGAGDSVSLASEAVARVGSPPS